MGECANGGVGSGGGGSDSGDSNSERGTTTVQQYNSWFISVT